jgi:hypothetical protein
MCVRRIELSEPWDWGVQPGAPAHFCTQPTWFCADCPALWLKSFSAGSYLEEYCGGLGPGTPARDLYELMSREAAAVAARW